MRKIAKTTARTWRETAAELRDALVRAQTHRDDRRQLVPLADGSTELGWVLYERAQMLEAVNALRKRDGRPPVTEAEILAAETTAYGHIDYTAKFAMNCADLVSAD